MVYLYRDGSNYKRWGEAVFDNPREISAAEIWRCFESASERWRLLPDVVHFRPDLLGLDTLFFTDLGYADNEDDLDLHELHRVDETTEFATDGRTIDELMADFETIEQRAVGGVDGPFQPAKLQ